MKRIRRQGSPPIASWPRGATVFVAVLVALSGPFCRAADPGFPKVDLARFYTTPLSDASPLPRGEQTLGGVPFSLGGKVELTGLDAARHGEFRPSEIVDIPVNGKAQRIHVLHGALHGEKDGTPLANIVVRYKNGETRTNRLSYGIHARNYLTERKARTSVLADPSSSIVWEQSIKSTNDIVARLYKTELENPLPDQEIASIGFYSLFNRATPVLFAVTIQSGAGLAPVTHSSDRKVSTRANRYPDSTYRAQLTLRVTDGSNGPPVANARAFLTLQNDTQSYYFGDAVSDSAGHLVLSYPPQEAVALGVRVSSPGYVAGSILLSQLQGSNMPPVIDVALERGRTIGGIVMDPAGKPVPGASIIPFQVKQVSSNEYTRTDFEIFKSGPDGKWTGAARSELLPEMSFQVSHPEYRTAVYPRLAAADLLKSSSTVALDPHLKVAGRVLTADRTPVAGATVILDYGGDAHTNQTADANGRFSFVVPDPTNSSAGLIAFSTQYAPSFIPVRLEQDAPTVELVLNEGSPFQMQIVDQNRIPISGVKVTLDRWQGSRALQWKTYTDDQGRFRWEHAPSGPITLRYEKTSYSIHTHSMSLPSNGEMTFTYTRPTRLYGRVIDSETKRAVEQFTYAARYQYQQNQPKRWYRYNSGSGRKGSFNTSLASFSGADWSLVVEAKGYEPYVSGVITNSGTFTNVVELKKGKPLVGVVTLANGEVVPKAEVVLLDSSASVYMDEDGKIRKQSSSYDIVSTDAKGAFELTPKPEPDLVIAQHPSKGFAQVPFAQFNQSGKIVLQPWGHVKGVLRIGNKVEPFHYVALYSDYQMENLDGRSQSPLYLYYKTKPAADGTFRFDAVPPGNRVAYLRYIFQDKETGSHKLSHNVPIVVKPGETNDIVIGGGGRKVIGKVEITSNPSSIDIDWHRDSHTMQYMPPPQGVPPPFSLPSNLSPEERQKKISERNEQLRAFYKEQSRLNAVNQHSYALVFNDDGTFEVPNVLPGSYTVHLSPTDPRQPNNYRTLASQSTQVTVPEGEGTFDVGVIKLALNQ